MESLPLLDSELVRRILNNFDLAFASGIRALSVRLFLLTSPQGGVSLAPRSCSHNFSDLYKPPTHCTLCHPLMSSFLSTSKPLALSARERSPDFSHASAFETVHPRLSEVWWARIHTWRTHDRRALNEHRNLHGLTIMKSYDSPLSYSPPRDCERPSDLVVDRVTQGIRFETTISPSCTTLIDTDAEAE
jgi:hypothetical protein